MDHTTSIDALFRSRNTAGDNKTLSKKDSAHAKQQLHRRTTNESCLTKSINDNKKEGSSLV